ncbi:expressed unknown protein [Seminavis robusta]|uniref:Uncharacterized protein n=1 Tax=Seminavis robusta TaxID=568900 RepID=A0A9N8HVV2_9STRA|nr:expressed unknown protein [Seminavis robusta]|eukprot:Sro1873_g302870.1 n/a (386) ;mRNA; f:4076-5233
MTDTEKKDVETPFTLATEDAPKNVTDAPVPVALDTEEDVAGFYINKSWWSKRNFGQYPERGYKPVYLNELNDTLWYEFNRDVQHYQKYYSHISWFYKFCILGPTAWFLLMVLPDLLWYYDIIFKGVGVVCGVVLAIAFSVDTYFQRRLLRRKIQPMYELLVATYAARFRLHGYNVAYKTERTALDGLNSYIMFRKCSVDDSAQPQPIEPVEFGFYLDEDIIGKKPYAVGMSSTVQPPRFFQGIETDTWKSFAKDIEDRSKTPPKYLLVYTIGMGIVVGTFAFCILYSIIYFSAIRHWFLIALVPLHLLFDVMRSFRRRHYVENVLVDDMKALLKEYEPRFAKSGYEASFELEYKLGYFVVNTFFNFIKKKGAKYEVAPLSDASVV